MLLLYDDLGSFTFDNSDDKKDAKRTINETANDDSDNNL